MVGAGDLQKKPIKVKWNDAFKEGKLTRLANSKIVLEQDTEKKKQFISVKELALVFLKEAV